MSAPKNVRVRISTGLHAALVQEAARQGVSLNTLIVTLLAGGISWQATDSKENDHAAQ